ncbi:MAG: ParA family protein [Raineya sp.]|nr:ParA family protein [Raineya sp.]
MKVIAITNNKGGVGKTTTALNIAGGLSKLQQRVLVIDLDPQANLTMSYGINERNQKHVGRLLLQELTFTEVVQSINGVDVLPASQSMIALEKKLVEETLSELFLKRVLAGLKNNYEFIIIDCGPNLGKLTANALCAATHFIVPVHTEFFSFKGIQTLFAFAQNVKDMINPEIELMGILLTKYNENTRTSVHKQVAESIRKSGNRVFKSVIRQNIALSESPMVGKDIFTYAPDSNGAKDYLQLCQEILNF